MDLRSLLIGFYYRKYVQQFSRKTFFLSLAQIQTNSPSSAWKNVLWNVLFYAFNVLTLKLFIYSCHESKKCSGMPFMIQMIQASIWLSLVWISAFDHATSTSEIQTTLGLDFGGSDFCIPLNTILFNSGLGRSVRDLLVLANVCYSGLHFPLHHLGIPLPLSGGANPGKIFFSNGAFINDVTQI